MDSKVLFPFLNADSEKVHHSDVCQHAKTHCLLIKKKPLKL